MIYRFKISTFDGNAIIIDHDTLKEKTIGETLLSGLYAKGYDFNKVCNVEEVARYSKQVAKRADALKVGRLSSKRVMRNTWKYSEDLRKRRKRLLESVETFEKYFRQETEKSNAIGVMAI